MTGTRRLRSSRVRRFSAGTMARASGYLDRRALRDEGVLHVDHDERRVPRIEPIEEMQLAAPRHYAIDDLLADLDRVHQNFSTHGLRSTSKVHAERGCR